MTRLCNEFERNPMFVFFRAPPAFLRQHRGIRSRLISVVPTSRQNVETGTSWFLPIISPSTSSLFRLRTKARRRCVRLFTRMSCADMEPLRDFCLIKVPSLSPSWSRDYVEPSESTKSSQVRIIPREMDLQRGSCER